MATTCLRCAASLPFDGAPCPECGSPAPAPEFYLGRVERPSIHEELLEHLRAVTSGEFEILREIGHGGMARVYLAHEVALDRQVALKVLSPLFADYPEIVKRFQHEARTAGQLNHPHIVPVFAVYQGDGLSFFTMPFVKGPSLREILREWGALELDEALDYLRQAASGLAYAHQHGVIHRDVKPENMMLEETTGRLVLTDFGLAKALGAESLTVPGDMIGTPQYMAPEQLADERSIDGRSDQYSLALVAYEMLTGQHPFDVSGFRELLMKQLNEDPLPLRERRSDLPEHVCWAIHRALAKSPGDRFDAVEDFARAMLGGAPSERSSRVLRGNGSRTSGVFGSKTLWMRDYLLRFHKRRRLKKWVGRAALSVAVSLAVYLAVAAVSRGGPLSLGHAANGTPEPAESGERRATPSIFTEIDPVAGDAFGSFGPPAPASASEGSGAPATPARQGVDPSQPTRESLRRGADSPAREPRSTPVRGSRPLTSVATRDNAAESGGEGSGSPGSASTGRRDDVAAGPKGDGSLAPSAEGALTTPEIVLERYRSALEAEDIEELGRLYEGEVPAEDLQLLTAIFERADDLQVELQNRGTRDEGDRRTFDVDFAMHYVLARTRQSREYTLKLRMTLEEGPRGWQLVQLDRR